MKLKLVSDPKTWKQSFLRLKDIDDLAALLEVARKTLIYLSYRKDKNTSYKEFFIAKKSGGKRKIDTPISSLKILQAKLSKILYEIYSSKASVHGFCYQKNIVTNSQRHINKKLVFNIDLEDFFPSINFGRVRGLFIAAPYKFPPKLATILANICCYKNGLPQGAPTSPIISNLICFRLDNQLYILAKKRNSIYTRYADDITFSTKANTFSEDIVRIDEEPKVGEKLEQIIKGNGFSINNRKTRLQRREQRQEVTGLVVNEKVNIKRPYVREVRVMLFNWRNHGLSHAEAEYYKRNRKERGPHKKGLPDLSRVIEGKINFIKMVKGQKSPVYRRLINEYNEILKNGITPYPLNSTEEINQNVWIVESNGVSNGTGFFMEKFGFVTCAHVLDLSGKIKIYKGEKPTEKYDAIVMALHKSLDLAILNIVGLNTQKNMGFKRAANKPKISDPLTATGFPLRFPGPYPLQYDSKIAGHRDRMFVPHIIIDRPVYSGMSGGPLLNLDNQVVGVIAFGAENVHNAHEIVGHSAVPIEFIDQVPAIEILI